MNYIGKGGGGGDGEEMYNLQPLNHLFLVVPSPTNRKGRPVMHLSPEERCSLPLLAENTISSSTKIINLVVARIITL